MDKKRYRTAGASLLGLLLLLAAPMQFITAPAASAADLGFSPQRDSRAFSGEPIWTFDTDWQCTHVETADLNADLIPDMIVGENSSNYYGYPARVYAIDGATGGQLWSYQLQDAVRSMTVGDINNDGTTDVIAGASYHGSQTPDGDIHAINGETGLALWVYPVNATITSLAVGNFDGDAYGDVAAGSFDDNVYAIRGSDGGLLWNRDIGSLWINDVAAGDVDGDGTDDVAYAHEYLAGFTNYFGVLDGNNSGTPLWELTTAHVVVSTMIHDIDDDGTLEAVFSTIDDLDQGWLYVRNGATGELEWQYNLGGIDHTNGNITLFAYDIDESDDPELVVGNYLGWYEILIFEGDAASVLITSEPMDGFPEDLAFGDVTGDGALEIVAATYDRVQVLGAADGKKLWYYSVAGSIDAVAVADFDDDGVTDVAAAGGAEYLGTPPNPGKGAWALKTVESPLLWEHLLGQYGNAVTVAHLNGDDFADVVAVTSVDDRAVAISGLNGSELWTWTGTQNLYAVTSGDFDNNGQVDIAVAGADDMVTAINGADGNTLWQFTTPGDQIYRKCLAATDINSDGAVDVIAGSDDGNVYAINGATGLEMWSTPVSGDAADIKLAQMNDIGPLDVVVASGGGFVYVLDGEGGGVLWSYACPAGVEHVAALDVNGDKIYDVAAGIAPTSRQVIMIDGATHLPLWSVPMEVASNTHGFGWGDLNGDELADLVVPGTSTDLKVHALNGLNGGELWTHTAGGEINTLWVQDMDGDGDNDVVAGGDDQFVYVLDGPTGALVWDYATSGDVMHIQVGDIAGPGLPSIACVTFDGDGTVYAFDSFFEPGCCAQRGDADAGGAINVNDLTYLVNYLFKSGPEPPCPEEGDVDASTTTNVSDLTYLVNYLFKSGPPPPAC